jgi:hypothetical protein
MTRVAIIVLLLAGSLVSALTGDLSGTWSGTFKANGSDHSTPQVVILRQEGDKLTGSAGPDAEEQYPIENGKIAGDRVTFELTTGEWRFSYDLKRTGADEMKGNLELTSVNNRRTAVVSLSRTK